MTEQAAERAKVAFAAPLTPGGTEDGAKVRRGGDVDLLLGLVRDVREAAQDVLHHVNDTATKGTLTEKNARTTEVLVAFARASKVFVRNSGEIEARFDRIRALLETDHKIHNRLGDMLLRIEHLWNEVTDEWPHEKVEHLSDPQRQDRAGDILASLQRVAGHLKAVIQEAARETIPARTNEHLDELRIGQALDFNGTFKDELEDEDQRKSVLQEIADHPAGIHGIVDVDRGLIVHTSPDPWRVFRSYLVIIVAYLLLPLALALISDSNGELATKILGGYAISYFILTAGALFHLLIDAVKVARSAANSTFTDLDQIGLWIHAREIKVVISIATLWIALGVVIFILKTSDAATIFATGYGIDSLTDMFIQRFNVSLGNSVTAIASRVKPPATAAAAG